jgi:hypothetical protein
MLSTAAPVSAGQSARGDARFDARAREHFFDGFRQSPVGATFTGYHAYDTKLDDVRPAAFAAGFRRERKELAALQAIDPATLSAETSIDRIMLVHAIEEDLLRNETLAQWRHDPDVYASLAANAVYGPVSRAYAPLEVRMMQVVARERAIPAMLAQARRNITTTDASTQRAAYSNATGTADLFRATLPLAFKPVTDPNLQASFAQANAGALSAVRAYAAWIQARKPSGTFALGARAFAQLLEYEDSIDMPLPRLLHVARAALQRARARYVATAREIDPTKSAPQVYTAISKVHPSGGELLVAAQGDLVRLRAFIIAAISSSSAISSARSFPRTKSIPGIS